MQTDMTRVTVAFREYAKAPKNKVKRGFQQHLKPQPQYLHIHLAAVAFTHNGKSRQSGLTVDMSRMVDSLLNDNVATSSAYVTCNRRMCEE
jgi:hypothetical protein